MSKKFLVSLVLIFSFVIFVGLSFPSCSKKDTSTPEITETSAILPSEPLATVDATTLDATITANYQSAETMAKQWKPDAVLYLASVKLPQDLSLNNATQTYTYGSANMPKDWWTYSLSESTGKYVRALIPKEDYLGDLTKPIDKAYWRTNYVEAFQIAEANGGTAFREANPNANIILTLSQSQPKGWLWWLVEYKTTSGNDLKVRINPNDKTVVDETGTIITTGGTYTGEKSVNPTSGATTQHQEFQSNSGTTYSESSSTTPTSTYTTY